ncbi:hypothetical protein AB205_0015100 [Aquarana catesbeiana]|uniref:Uncharacterized protein n=1 Tax=Aquarana catesbeiana TaxID=8400 RepID=A0A2G9NXW3_AQUCT|nr:hypothetical protein AB205_0015100 [Aquarana catesbeiana]
MLVLIYATTVPHKSVIGSEEIRCVICVPRTPEVIPACWASVYGQSCTWYRHTQE